jgi:hypothetical protein
MVDILQGASVKVYRTILRCTCTDGGKNHYQAPCPNAREEVLEQAPKEK